MNRTVLSFGAHPDDIEIGCGGTESKLISKGFQVHHVYITSGEAGSKTLTKKELKDIRENEALQSAKILGVCKVHFLGASDGFTQFDEALRAQVINLIRDIKPQKIFVHGECDLFPDHRLVHQLVKSAIAGAAGPWFQETIGEPWNVPEVYGYEVWHPMAEFQLAVDISKHLKMKIKALQCFKSQVTPTKYDEAFTGLARYRGVMSWAGQYAEVFEVIRAATL